MTTLLDKIDNRTAVIGIVGLGYVGLPLAVVFAEVGFRVKRICFCQPKRGPLDNRKGTHLAARA